MMVAGISRLHFPVTTLGPGRRVGVWFQGCSLRCPGCISPDTWEQGVGETTIEEVLGALAPWQGEADGLTVSGGEPFEQGEALAALLEGWRASSPGDVLVFTGLELAAVERWLADHPGLIDALVTGPFLQDRPQTLALRGSDNQELHVLTPLGRSFLAFERTVGPDDRRLDAMFDAGGAVWFAGIPGRNDFRRLRDALEAESHAVFFSPRARGTA